MKAIPSLLAVLLMLSCTSLAQTAPAQQPEAESQQTVVAFGPGAKIFVEPMDGFGELVSDAITKKKLPVVLVNEREKADFVMSGAAHVKKPGFFKGWITTDSGKGNISIKDAHTGNQVFFYKFTRVDSMTTESQLYANWAGGCANHLKKALEKTEKK